MISFTTSSCIEECWRISSPIKCNPKTFDLIKRFSLESVEKKISERTCAIIVEPILGEGGIVTLSCFFLKGLKDLCEKYNLLLIFDEVQSGIGRSGHFLAHESCEVTPDIVTLAKGLGNGFPIGACLAT